MGEVRFIAPRVPFVDLRTGQITREWFLFLQGFFPSQSGSVADDMMLALGQTNAAPEMEANFYAFQQWSQLGGDLASMRDEIAELRKGLDDIRKGAWVL